MRTNQPLGTVLKKATLCLLLLSLFLVHSQNARAQTNTYVPLKGPGGAGFTVASSTVPVFGTDVFDSKDNAINSSVDDPATWSYLASLGGSAWIEVKKNSGSYAAGSYAGFVFSTGGLLEALSTTKIETFITGSTGPEETYTPDNSLLSASLLSSTSAKVGFVTKKAFDRVRITFTVPVGLAGSRSVYYAEVLTPEQPAAAPVCNAITAVQQTAYPAVVSSGTGGLATVNALQSVFSNIESVVDKTKPGPATINGTVLVGVGDSAYISVREAGLGNFHPAGYFAGFEIADGGGNLAQIGLLKNTIVATYLDGAFQESVSSDNLLLSAPVLAGGGKTTVGFITTKSFNEIRFIRKNIVGISLLSSLNVYNAVIKRFCNGPTLACNTLTPISSEEHPVYIDAGKTGTDGVADVNLLSNKANYDKIIDGNNQTFTTIDFSLIGLNAHKIAVANALDTYGAGTYVGFDIRMRTLADINILSNIQINLYKRGVTAPVQTATGLSLLAGVKTDLLAGQAYTRMPMGMIARTDFDEVQIVISKPVNISLLGSMDIFDFVIQNNCEKVITCSNTTTLITSGSPTGYDVVIDGTHTGFNGLVSAAGSIENPWNIINGDVNDFARISLAADVAATGSITVAAGKTVFPKGIFAGFLVKENVGGLSPLVLANLLKLMKVTLYYRNPATGVRTEVGVGGTGQLIGLTAVLPLLGNDHGTKLIGFVSPAAFNEIEISTTGLAEVGLPRALDIYGFAIDTRYSNGEGGGLSCPFFKTNPDINYTTINKPVEGSVATNDMVPGGTTYSNPTPVNGADGLPNPAGATLTLDQDALGGYTFVTPTPGTYSYNITATSGTNSEVQDLTIIVSDPGTTTNLPVANTDIAVTNAGAPVTVTILANDHAGNQGGTLGTPEVFKQGSNGTATMNGSQLVYTPSDGFMGKDTVVYKVCETPGTNLCAYAYVFVEVKPGQINTTSATDDFNMTNAGTAVSGNVKDNDIDAEGDPQTVTAQEIVNDPVLGNFVLTSDGRYTFTPKASFSGTAQFKYEIHDNKGASATGTLYVYTKGSATDLTVILAAEPNQVEGTKAIDLRITVYTTNAEPTNGSDVYVRIPKSPNFTLNTYAPALTDLNGQPVQNADWEFAGMDGNQLNYLFKLGGTNLKKVINGSSASTFGCTVTFNGGSNAGVEKIGANIFGGSGGDGTSANNSDTETIRYNP